MRRNDLVKCKFLIAWAEGSPSSGGVKTGVHGLADLSENNECVDVYEYEAPAGWAWEVGASKAFEEGFTAQDACSTVYVLNGTEWIAGYNLSLHD